MEMGDVVCKATSCIFPLNRKSGGKTDTEHSKGKSPAVYEKAKRLRLSDIYQESSFIDVFRASIFDLCC